MNLDKNSYALYRNGMYEKYDGSINPILFNHVPVDENKYAPAEWITDRSNLSELNANYSKIGNGGFAFCNNLQKVSFPYCEYVGEGAFYNCTSLTEVNLSVCSYIGSSAFYSCTSLTEISLPVCDYIGDYAFSGCKSLTEINLPACSYVGSSAFEHCKSLTSIDLPACKYIGSSAFCSCSKLESIYLTNSSVTTLSNINAFGNTPMSNSSYIGKFGSIYVPTSLLFQYKTATNWSTYSSRFVGI